MVAGTRVVDILLLDLPVALWAASAAHLARVVAALRAEPRRGAAAELVEIVDRLGGDFAEVSAPSELELRAAAARHLKQVDVAYGVPRECRDDLAALPGILDKVDKSMRARGCVELVTPPEQVAFRRWLLDQAVTQLDGGFPTAWSG